MPKVREHREEVEEARRGTEKSVVWSGRRGSSGRKAVK